MKWLKWDRRSIVNFLDAIEIDYKTGGKNVGQNDLNIDCPFCYADKHLSVSDKGLVYCWVCNFEGEEKKPSFLKIAHLLSGRSWNEIFSIAEEFAESEEKETTKKEPEKKDLLLHYPPSTHFLSKPLNSPILETERLKAINYLEKRDFNFIFLEKVYGVRFTLAKNFIQRLIIPIFDESGKMVNWFARDYTNKSDRSRYKDCPSSISLIPKNKTLYGLNFIGEKNKTIYLVEGPTDQWRIGNGALAVGKSAVSPEQENIIRRLKPESLIYLFDEGATGRAISSAERLSAVIPEIKIVKIKGADIADRTIENVFSLIESTNPAKF